MLLDIVSQNTVCLPDPTVTVFLRIIITCCKSQFKAAGTNTAQLSAAVISCLATYRLALHQCSAWLLAAN